MQYIFNHFSFANNLWVSLFFSSSLLLECIPKDWHSAATLSIQLQFFCYNFTVGMIGASMFQCKSQRPRTNAAQTIAVIVIDSLIILLVIKRLHHYLYPPHSLWPKLWPKLIAFCLLVIWVIVRGALTMHSIEVPTISRWKVGDGRWWSIKLD